MQTAIFNAALYNPMGRAPDQHWSRFDGKKKTVLHYAGGIPSSVPYLPVTMLTTLVSRCGKSIKYFCHTGWHLRAWREE